MVSFNYWKQSVENVVYLLIGLHLDDLPDENYHINYENGFHVCDMAKIVILNFENDHEETFNKNIAINEGHFTPCDYELLF